MSPVIRRALAGEADALTAIAHAAKRHWGYPEEWIARWRDALTVTPAYVRDHAVFVAAEDDVPRGFYALSTEGTSAILDHLWVTPERMGAGMGRALFRHAAETARAQGATRLEIDSDPHAEEFYQRMGARRIGEVPADVDGVRRVLPRLELILCTASGETAVRTEETARENSANSVDSV
jgi:GNAT superfamily N-acetyltransferase